MNVEAWLQRAANERPDHVAIEAGGQTLSYAELYRRAALGAQRLDELGAAPRKQVAIALAPGIDFAVALHATLLAGAVAVPIDLRLSGEERALRSDGCALLLKRPIAIDATAAPPRQEYSHQLDEVAIKIFTSGTSATPKPVRLTYGNILFAALGSAVAIGLDREDRWLCAMPLAHIGGLSILLRSCIYSTTAVLHERFRTDAVLSALCEQQITVVSLVATTLERLLEAGLERPAQLRCALIGGGPVAEALVERARARGVPAFPTYGLSESCAQAATEPLADPGGGARAIFCTRLRISDEGEILLAGPTIAASALADDGWLHTGDLGALDGNGALRVLGRRSETIISGGENVAPEEVEAALELHPAVAEAAVIGRADEQWGEVVTAVIVPVAGAASPDPEQLRSHLRGHLAPYKIPKRFELARQPLPRSAAGKLMRRKLR